MPDFRNSRKWHYGALYFGAAKMQKKGFKSKFRHSSNEKLNFMNNWL